MNEPWMDVLMKVGDSASNSNAQRKPRVPAEYGSAPICIPDQVIESSIIYVLGHKHSSALVDAAANKSIQIWVVDARHHLHHFQEPVLGVAPSQVLFDHLDGNSCAII